MPQVIRRDRFIRAQLTHSAGRIDDHFAVPDGRHGEGRQPAFLANRLEFDGHLVGLLLRRPWRINEDSQTEDDGERPM